MEKIEFYIVVALLFVVAGVANAVMDKVQFHFDKSMFRTFANQQFWDPGVSWRNKWKNGNKEDGEKFWGSSTVFVFTTDAWHLFKWIFTHSLFIGTVLAATGGSYKMVLYLYPLLIFQKFIFQIVFKRALGN